MPPELPDEFIPPTLAHEETTPDQQPEEFVDMKGQEPQEKHPLPSAEEARQAGYHLTGEVMSAINGDDGHWHDLPEPGYMGTNFWVTEDNADSVRLLKGRGFGQALLLETARTNGAFYSVVDQTLEPTRQVMNALQRKGLAVVSEITVGGYHLYMLKPTEAGGKTADGTKHDSRPS